jgi:hypothetical protein
MFDGSRANQLGATAPIGNKSKNTIKNFGWRKIFSLLRLYLAQLSEALYGLSYQYQRSPDELNSRQYLHENRDQKLFVECALEHLFRFSM